MLLTEIQINKIKETFPDARVRPVGDAGEYRIKGVPLDQVEKLLKSNAEEIMTEPKRQPETIPNQPGIENALGSFIMATAGPQITAAMQQFSAKEQEINNKIQAFDAKVSNREKEHEASIVELTKGVMDSVKDCLDSVNKIEIELTAIKTSYQAKIDEANKAISEAKARVDGFVDHIKKFSE